MTSTDPARKTFITTYQIFCPIHFREVDLASLVPTLDAMGADFLNKMMHHSNPVKLLHKKRWSIDSSLTWLDVVYNRNKFTNRPWHKICITRLMYGEMK